MTTLSVHTFGTPEAAQLKIGRLESRLGRRIVTEDAAVISWPPEADRPDAWQASPIGALHPLSGAFWGLLFAHLFLIPRSYSEPPRIALDQTDDTLVPLGLDGRHLEMIRSRLTPGRSAVLALHRDEDLNALTALLDAGAPADIAIVLDPIQSRRLYSGFAENHLETT